LSELLPGSGSGNLDDKLAFVADWNLQIASDLKTFEQRELALGTVNKQFTVVLKKCFPAAPPENSKHRLMTGITLLFRGFGRGE
jgi:hypothetical protein